MARAYRRPIGPSMPAGSRGFGGAIASVPNAVSGAGGVTLALDMQPALKSIEKTLSAFSANVQRIALYNAINHVASKGLTRIRRDVAKQAGVSYKIASKVIKLDRAHPNRLYARFKASDKAMRLIWFAKNAAVGQKNIKAAPWGKSRTFPGTFIIRWKDGGLDVATRNAASSTHKRQAGGGGKVKVLFGPIVPREMIRPGTPSMQYLQTVVPVELVPRMVHELGQALARGHR